MLYGNHLAVSVRQILLLTLHLALPIVQKLMSIYMMAISRLKECEQQEKQQSFLLEDLVSYEAFR